MQFSRTGSSERLASAKGVAAFVAIPLSDVGLVCPAFSCPSDGRILLSKAVICGASGAIGGSIAPLPERLAKVCSPGAKPKLRSFKRDTIQ
jgi:hypothetical protein